MTSILFRAGEALRMCSMVIFKPFNFAVINNRSPLKNKHFLLIKKILFKEEYIFRNQVLGSVFFNIEVFIYFTMCYILKGVKQKHKQLDPPTRKSDASKI